MTTPTVSSIAEEASPMPQLTVVVAVDGVEKMS
jgi:hypothetical protein